MSAVPKFVGRRELMLGCGHRRVKGVWYGGIPTDFSNLTTLDIMPEHKPDVVHDMTVLPLPFEDNSFDEIHAYEVLEHTGQQGDWKFFFAQFEDFWRILKPGGHFCGSTPMWDSEWAWADPGHTRIITPKTLTFLQQEFYDAQEGTVATDYRPFYKADYRLVAMQEKDHRFYFIMQALK